MISGASEEEIKKTIESVQSQTMNTMSYNDSLKLEKYIEQLQQENKELKEDKEIISKGFHTAMSDMCKCQNILNELESWLQERLKIAKEIFKRYDFDWSNDSTYKEVLDKLKELKGSDE